MTWSGSERVTLGLALMVVLLCSKPILSQEPVDCNFAIPRPPEFPDIMNSFMQTFRFDASLLQMKESLVEEYTQPELCNCTAAIVEDWTDYNSQCEVTQPECPQTTTAAPTTTEATTTEATTTVAKTTVTTTMKATTTATELKTTKRVTTPAVVPDPSTTSTTGARSSSPQQSTTTTSRPRSTKPSMPVETTGDSSQVTQDVTPAGTVSKSGMSSTVRNIIIASVCGGLLAFIVFIITICVARKQPSRESARFKSEKLARQRSDCLPLPENTFDNAPNTPSTKDSLNGYNNSGFLWPEDDPKGIILENPEDAFHYNTLKAMEHPHALVAGFGETSTETMPKKSKKKRSKYKKTDANHNSRNGGNSVGRNSLGNQSSDSMTEKMSAKGSVKSKGSVRSRDSGLGTKRNSALPPAAEMLSNDLMKFSTEKDDEDLIDGKNAHLFAYTNGAVISSNPSITGSEVILAPPPEFQDMKAHDSPFNSNDRRRTEDPPTAVVRPSVKELVKRQESRSSSGSSGSNGKKPVKEDQVNISMEDMSSSPDTIYTIEGNQTQQQQPTPNGKVVTANGTPKPKSFLWASPTKKSSNSMYKLPQNMKKTVL